MGHPIRLKSKTAQVAVLFLCLFLSGCVTLRDPEASQEYSADLVATISPGQTAGQTFVSRRPRLNQVQLWLRQSKPPVQPDGEVLAELYASPDAKQPLARVSIRYTTIARSLLVTIPLPPQSNQLDQSYYLVLKTGDGEVSLLGRAEDAYPNGELRVNGEPREADAAFRLGYAYDASAILEDTTKALSGIWLVIPLILLLWVPGRLLVSFIEERMDLDWGERNALAVGLSMALVPLVMLWTTALHLSWSRDLVIVVYALAAAGLTWRLRRTHPNRIRPLINGTDLALAAILVFSLAIRLAMVRDLAAPAWVDSVHHATITRLILQEGGFPKSYAATMQSEASGYHPGFHSLAAVFHWLSGLDLPENLLLLGQVLNAACILGMYLLTTTLTKNRLAGLFAALIAGIFSPMPAYYTSWGRYTQLTGLVILPAALMLILATLEDRQTDWKRRAGFMGVAAIACGGLFMTHYRVAIFLALLLAAYLFGEALRNLDKQPLWKSAPPVFGRLGVLAIFSLLITLPWWPTLYQSMIAPRLALRPLGPTPLIVDWGLLTPACGKATLILAAGGLIWSIFRARWFGPVLALWIGLLYMSANQGMLALPVSTGINKTSVEIMFFMPIVILGGYLIGDLIQLTTSFLPQRLRRPYYIGIALITSVLAVIGAQRLLPILNHTTILFRQADREAITWADQNLPPDGQFSINPFLWGYGLYAGQDGGYWITPLSGRRTLPPPVLYGIGNKEDISEITQTSRLVLDKSKDPAGLYTLLKMQGISYIFTGGRGGAISPAALNNSPLFETLYHQDGVWIFRLR